MIPNHKLKRLPRHQRLRKIANALEAEDARLAASPAFEPFSFRDRYLLEIAQVLSEDSDFSADFRNEICTVSAEFASRFAAGSPYERRSVNSLRHIVNSVIGKQTADWDLVDTQGRLSSAARVVLPGVRIFLEDIRSPFNVGSIFRAAESFGVERVFLSPLCAAPDHPRAARSSMGCVDLVPWERKRLEELEGPFFALETGGTPVDDFPYPERGLLIIGSEELGVSPSALGAAEASLGRVTIPTIGAKGSLNVSVAFGIAMREWCSRLI